MSLIDTKYFFDLFSSAAVPRHASRDLCVGGGDLPNGIQTLPLFYVFKSEMTLL